MTVQEIRDALKTRKDRSAWDKGVTEYALEILATVEDRILHEKHIPENRKELKDYMLNGAETWAQASYGGCFEIYDSDIAEKLCCPSELKKTRGGERNPNSRETWLDVQARALFQAGNRILQAAHF